jgi:hypothetical protein
MLIDVPTAPTTALALSDDPLLSTTFSFVIPPAPACRGSVPGFPTSPFSQATTYMVLPKENHMQLTEAATLNRKSGEPRDLRCAIRVPRPCRSTTSTESSWKYQPLLSHPGGHGIGVINEAFARRFFKNENPLRKHFERGNASTRYLFPRVQ